MKRGRRAADDQDRQADDSDNPTGKGEIGDAGDQGQQHEQQAQVGPQVRVDAEEPPERGPVRGRAACAAAAGWSLVGAIGVRDFVRGAVARDDPPRSRPRPRRGAVRVRPQVFLGVDRASCTSAGRHQRASPRRRILFDELGTGRHDGFLVRRGCRRYHEIAVGPMRRAAARAPPRRNRSSRAGLVGDNTANQPAAAQVAQHGTARRLERPRRFMLAARRRAIS